MKEFEELEVLFESKTIKPSFDYVHVILAILLFGDNPKGLGRYRLKEELLIGEGTAKSLVKKLKRKGGFIEVLVKKNQPQAKLKGHVLTENGIQILRKIKKKIPLLDEGDNSILNDFIINSETSKSFYCLVRGATNRLRSGVEQRDAAIRLDGLGATCLIYNGNELLFPSYSSEQENHGVKINDKIQLYFKTNLIKVNISFKKGDVIIIGSGNDIRKARLAALNAALTLL